MKPLGFVLVVLGVVALVFGGLSWTRQDTVIDAGPVEITRDKEEGIAIPPMVGGLLLVAGVGLLVARART